MKDNTIRLSLLSLTDKDVGIKIRTCKSLINGKTIKEYKNENKQIVNLENEFFYYCNKEIKDDAKPMKKPLVCKQRQKKTKFVLNKSKLVNVKKPLCPAGQFRLSLASKKLSHFNIIHNITERSLSKDTRRSFLTLHNNGILTSSEIKERYLIIYYSYLNELCFSLKNSFVQPPSLKDKITKFNKLRLKQSVIKEETMKETCKEAFDCGVNNKHSRRKSLNENKLSYRSKLKSRSFSSISSKQSSSQIITKRKLKFSNDMSINISFNSNSDNDSPSDMMSDNLEDANINLY